MLFGDEKAASFHYIWLRDNSQDMVHPSSGQRVKNISSLPLDIAPAEIRLDGNATECQPSVIISWSDGTTAKFRGDWLRDYAYDHEFLSDRDDKIRPRAFSGDLPHPNVVYSEVISSEEGLASWLRAIDEHGWALVHGMPNVSGVVRRLAERVGTVSHNSLYGECLTSGQNDS